VEGELIQRMDGFGWIIGAVVLFNIIRALVKGNAEGEGGAPPPQKRRVPKPQRPTKPKVVYPDPEGWKRPPAPASRTSRTSVAGPSGRGSRSVAVESSGGWEETASLEIEEQVESLEERGTGRSLRVQVDRDDEAMGVAEGRKVAAASRDGETLPEDHRVFDQEIRTPAVVAVGRDRISGSELRKAFIWTEILGRPVSER
jgi:hypothetical protein